MNVFKREAFFDQFKFLEEIFDYEKAQKIKSIKVKRIDENLLWRKPINTDYLTEPEDYSEFYIGYNQRDSQTEIPDIAKFKVDQSLLESIYEEYLDDFISHIVEVKVELEEEYFGDRCDYRDVKYSVIVYREPKDISIHDLIQTAEKRAAKEVAREIEHC